MLSKQMFKNGIQELAAVFPNWKMDIESPESMATWYKYFKDFDDVQFINTVANYCKRERNNPTIAGLMENKSERSSDAPRVIIEVIE